MNNYNNEYRFFGGPFLPFVGGLVVGGLFSPNKGPNFFGNNQPIPQGPYPIPVNGPYPVVYQPPLIQQPTLYPTSENQIYYFQDPQINLNSNPLETRLYRSYYL